MDKQRLLAYGKRMLAEGWKAERVREVSCEEIETYEWRSPSGKVFRGKTDAGPEEPPEAAVSFYLLSE